MALKTDDEDIRDVRMWIEVGGNGDYYINLYQSDVNRAYYGQSERIDMRISMSGGNAPHDVKMAIAALYRAMEKHNLNNHPKED